MAIENANTITLDQHDISGIRHALLIGLESFGEVERLDDQQGLFSWVKLPEQLRVIHPTGAPDTIGVFANALRILER